MLILIEALLVLVGAALVALVLLGLPGTWLFLAACVGTEWLTDADLFHTWTLIAGVAIAALGELAEFLSGSVGARRSGASRAGALGALGGGIVGAVAGTLFIPVPLIGTLLGGCLGAFVLATVAEQRGGRELREALRAGSGAAIGQVTGLILKMAAGVVCWCVMAVAAFVP